MLVTVMKNKLKELVGVGVVVITVSGCGLVGGGTGLGEACETSTRTVAAEYVGLMGEQVDVGVEGIADVAAVAAVDSFQRVLDACRDDDLSAAVSLYVTTVGNAAAAEEPNRQGALYAGIKEICTTEIPRRDEKIVLSDDAQLVCDRAKTDATPPEDKVDTNDGTQAYQLRYVLEGTGAATVRFLTPSGTEETQTVQLPWEWRDESRLPLPNMSATLRDDGQGICAIYIDDVRRAEGGRSPETGIIVCEYDAALEFTQGGGAKLPPPSGEVEALINELLVQNPALQEQ